jgi:ABC-2 type transport system ATP-binding protein
VTPSIELKGVGKRYWKIQERSLLRAMVPLGQYRSELWALQDVNFEIEPGETVGLIGQNGAGKSTLLRLLAGVTQPTTGELTIRGRVAPLLSVGVGFHQEMTGRENIYVNGMLLGLTRAEIAERFDDIVAFANLADFIDTPVKFYSSGMYMRLGFSVVIHVDPDILLIDEVLAVGDIGFQLRCFDRIRALQQAGTTVVFVSHSMNIVHHLCPRGLLLRSGQLDFDGATESAIARYHQTQIVGDEDDPGAPVVVVQRELLGEDGAPRDSAEQEDVLTYRAVVRFARPVESPQVFFRVLAPDATVAYSMHTDHRAWRSFDAGEEATVEVRFQPRFGGGGTFRIALIISDADGNDVLFHDQQGSSFYVPQRLGVMGVADLGATIAVDGEARTDHRELRLGAQAVAAPD